MALRSGDAIIAAVVVLGLGLALAMRRSLRQSRVSLTLLLLALVGVAGSFVTVHGRFVIIPALSVFIALASSATFPSRLLWAEWMPSDRSLAFALFLLVFGIGTVFALHRYSAFGAGSWDHGCMVHNFYRAAFGLDSISTVLGGVDYLGDHFMIGIFLYAPLVWLHSAGETVLLIQTANLAVVAPVVFSIARRHGAERAPSFALGLVAGFSFGNQAAMYFDSHEITVGFGFLALCVWAIEADRLWLASLFAALFATFKESLGAYVVGLGLLLLLRALVRRDRRQLLFGLGFIFCGAIWFVLVNRVFMPALIARGKPPEPHETFTDFGPTIFVAVLAMLSSPVKTAAALFVPTTKVSSQLVTLFGVGGLAMAAPSIGLAALPLLAERFLSSKHTMWEMGYHYGASLCLYAAWAAALGLPAVARWIGVLAESIGASPRRASLALTFYLVVCAALVNEAGYSHAANFHRWDMDYFAPDERRQAHQGAIRLLRSRPVTEKLAVQNRILPHLADRPFIYRLGDHGLADHVLLSLGENAWPWDDGFAARVAQILAKTHRLTYSVRGTAVFTRCRPELDPCAELPEAAPSPSLAPLLLR
ncbi:MAG: DUF2079 domain-containing protein [Deltaproteobacteria bacterium]|nr:DUF2079 domain-containing protein [Deltaproteobacteria bacterium]